MTTLPSSLSCFSSVGLVSVGWFVAPACFFAGGWADSLVALRFCDRLWLSVMIGGEAPGRSVCFHCFAAGKRGRDSVLLSSRSRSFSRRAGVSLSAGAGAAGGVSGGSASLPLDANNEGFVGGGVSSTFVQSSISVSMPSCISWARSRGAAGWWAASAIHPMDASCTIEKFFLCV